MENSRAGSGGKERYEGMELEEGGAGAGGGEGGSGEGGEQGRERGIRAAIRSVIQLVKGKLLVRNRGEGGMIVKDKGEQLDFGEEAVEIEEYLQDVEAEGIEIREEIVEKEEVKDTTIDEDGNLSSILEDNLFSFLDNIGESSKDQEAERKKAETKKRKRGETEFLVNMRGLLGTRGWEEREETTKEDKRWIRKVSENGVVREEGMPLPEEYILGLEKRGEELNSSARAKNGMGTGRNAIFPKEGNQKGEGRNWIASFTKAGCISCRNEREELIHQGRNSDPVVLIVGDEATPMSVGFTKEGKGEQGCAWIFKKEHMQLGEVAGILRRINTDKQEQDRENGKRPHEFFVPNGSKILVSSYTHLRKEGLEGYIADFCNMVKDVWAVTGDCGIEVLPVVPVIFEGLDSEGGKLISGLKDWIEWIGEESGMVSVKQLAGTGGREEGGEEGRFFYKPQMVLLKSKVKDRKEWAPRGNMVSLVRAERREVIVKEAKPSKELVRLVNRGEVRAEGEEESEEESRRGSFKEGISIDGEYTFSTALERFTREAVKEGSYRGAYNLNIKEQMRRRVRKAVEGESRIRVLTVGASETGRIRQEVQKRGEGKIVMEEHVRIRGKLDRKESDRVQGHLERLDIAPDVVLLGGPGNSIVENGRQSGKGKGADMVVKVSRSQSGRVEKIDGEFHLIEPVRPTMCERRVVAGAIGRIVKKIRELWPLVEIVYMEIFPRHVHRCCQEKGHMCEEDPQVIDRSRRDMEEEVASEFRRLRESVRRVKWWEAIGLESEPNLETIRRRQVVGEDGVHMNTVDMKRVAALFCKKLTESEEEPVSKRRKDV